MSVSFDLFRPFRSSKNQKNNHLSSSKRSLRMEPLEDRALLAVTLGDYQAIANAYPELGYDPKAFADQAAWEAQTTINVIEIGGESDQAFDVGNLRTAISNAATGAGNDLIVVRTTEALNTLQLGGSQISIDSAVGSITIVGLGDAPLTLDAGGTSRVMQIQNSDVNLANMTIANGNASGDGGGIRFYANTADSTVIMTSVTFKDNRASGNGGGFYQSRYGVTASSNFCNVLFDTNTAGVQGGGIAIIGAGTNNTNQTHLLNCTVVNNSAAGSTGNNGGGGGIYARDNNQTVTIENSVFWGNKATSGDSKDIVLGSGGTKKVSNSLWGTGYGINASSTDNNLNPNTDPLFTNFAGRDYSLSPSSPLINAGDNGTIKASSHDLAGNPRIYGGKVDVGAFELQQDQYIARNDGSAEAPIIIDLKTTTPEKVTIPAGYGDWSGLEVQAFELNVLGNDTFTVGTNPYIEIVSNISGNTMTNGMMFVADGKLYYGWGLGIGDVYSFSYKIGADAGSPLSNEATVMFKVVYDGPILVSTLEDETDYDLTNGDLSLREALALADKLGASSIGVAEGLIDLTDTTPGANTIVLSQETGFGAIVLNSDITITAPGLTIDASGNSQIFVLQGESGALIDVTLVGMILDNGNTEENGGAIHATYVDLTLTDMTIRNSYAFQNGGGLYAYNSSVTMTGGAFESNTADNGGAFADGGSIDAGLAYTFDGVVFDSNWANYGGALNVRFGDSAITNSQFFRNYADNNGGAVWYADKKLDISHSLFALNMAAGDGGALFIGDMVATTIINATIVDNKADMDGGGISFSGAVTMTNSIVANNTAADQGMDIYPGLSTAAITGSNNLIGQGNSSDLYDFGLSHGDAGNLVGNANAPFDPRLDGEYKPTESSLAVGYGSDGKDIGWLDTDFEANDIIWVKNLNNSGANSLRWALDQAYATEGYDSIVFAAGLNGTLNLSAQLSIKSDVSIYGLGNTIDGLDSMRIFYVPGQEVDVYITGFNLKNGKASYGGAVSVEYATLTLDYVNISDSYAEKGGAIFAYNGSITVSNSTIENCEASLAGGAVWRRGDNDSTSAKFINVTFTNNSVTGNHYGGGAIYTSDSSTETILLVDCTFELNSAANGGALYAKQSSFDVFGSTFENNAATNYGGAVYFAAGYQGTSAFNKTDFINNSAALRGGAVYAYGGTLQFSDVLFQLNSTSESGGAVWKYGTSSNQTTFTNVVFDQNKVSNLAYGGAYYQSTGSTETVTFDGATFTSNEAKYGAAIHIAGGKATLSDYAFTDNLASKSGSGLYWNSAKVVIELTVDERTETSDEALINFLDEPTEDWLDLLAGN